VGLQNVPKLSIVVLILVCGLQEGYSSSPPGWQLCDPLPRGPSPGRHARNGVPRSIATPCSGGVPVASSPLNCAHAVVPLQRGAELLIHPGCACSAEMKKGAACLDSGHFLFNEQMLRCAATSATDEFIVATEKGLVYRLRAECPAKKLNPISDAAVCEYMKMNTLEKLRNSLRNDQCEVEVDHDVSNKARGAISRMLSIH
jgi:hypothetical protein